MQSQLSDSRQQLPSAPLVSVILPVYNGERYLRESIESILTQTFRDYELVIVDDGSTDATAALLDTYTDPRIVRLTNPTNIGLIGSLNRALKLVRGTYIARMDADDISLPNRLEQQVEFLDNNPEIGIVGTRLQVIDSFGKVRESVPDKRPISPQVIHWMMFFGCMVTHATMMSRREVLDALGSYDPAFEHAEDYELFLRASFITRMANLPEALYQVREHDQRVSAVYSSAQQESSNRAVQKALSAYIDKEVSFETTRALRNWHYVVDANHAFEIGQFLRDLWQTYLRSTNLSEFEKKQISTDAASRLAELVIICAKTKPILAIKSCKTLVEFQPEHLERLVIFIMSRAVRYGIRRGTLQEGNA